MDGCLGLVLLIRRVMYERPLCGEVEGSDVLKELPKFRLWSPAHGSIRVQEGQPTTPLISEAERLPPYCRVFSDAWRMGGRTETRT